MLPTFNDIKIICKSNDVFKSKYQKFGETEVVQCTYFLAQPVDFFPTILELEENGKTIELYGELVFNEKKLKEMTDTEIESLGFDFLTQFSFGQ
jgi:hypothetical protein